MKKMQFLIKKILFFFRCKIPKNAESGSALKPMRILNTAINLKEQNERDLLECRAGRKCRILPSHQTKSKFWKVKNI
jgi:hypothetical protein